VDADRFGGVVLLRRASRATNDVDIVVDPTADQIEAFAASLSVSFYVNRGEVRE
jgi:hypothetical protein